MLRLGLNEAKVDASTYFILPIKDAKNHANWIKLIAECSPKFDVVYSNELSQMALSLMGNANYQVHSVPPYHREIYSGTEVRRRMLTDGNWEVLLPRNVADFVKEIDGVSRVKNATSRRQTKVV